MYLCGDPTSTVLVEAPLVQVYERLLLHGATMLPNPPGRGEAFASIDIAACREFYCYRERESRSCHLSLSLTRGAYVCEVEIVIYPALCLRVSLDDDQHWSEKQGNREITAVSVNSKHA